MGLTRDEGRRLYLYEAYSIVMASSLLGLIIGLCACTLVSAQIFTFVELPKVILFPKWTFLGMMCIALITTYLAVFMPMRTVNQKQIAVVLKAGA